MTRSTLDLSGTWSVALDAADTGIAEAWWDRSFDGSISLPGSLQTQGLGEAPGPQTSWVGSIFDRSWSIAAEYARYREPGNVRIPFWLQPQRCWQGPAWYARSFSWPQAWAGRRGRLVLERCHWRTSAWIDGRELGSADSLATAHVYDLGQLAAGEHRLVLRVDNRILDVDPGPNAHSVSDHIQSNWNGVIGRLAIEAVPQARLTGIEVHPDAAARRFRVLLRIRSDLVAADQARMQVSAHGRGFPSSATAGQLIALPPGDSAHWLELGLDTAARTWSEFDPALYDVTATLAVPGQLEDVETTTAGLRDWTAHGTGFAINGSPVYLRGTHDAGCFPDTGYPATGIDAWRRIFAVCRAHGLNHVRYHSWCPPEAAFQAADEAGFYLQVECGVWANQGATIGDGGGLDAWLPREAERIIRAYGNHPSFVLLAHGNEPAGRNHVAYLTQLVQAWKARGDRRRLVTAAANYPAISDNDYHNPSCMMHGGWNTTIHAAINTREPSTCTDWSEAVARHAVPLVSHEIGQWCAFPDLAAEEREHGFLQPRGLGVIRDRLAAAGMLPLAGRFLEASGRLQVACYKEEIEASLRTHGQGGFVLLDLHDFPGQGNAPVGVLDARWQGKGYCSAEEYRSFCSPTVALARLPRRIFSAGQRLQASLEVAHFGAQELTGDDAVIRWRLCEDERVLADGGFAPARIPLGQHALGAINHQLPQDRACRLRLEVAVGRLPANSWDLWAYPSGAPAAVPDGILVAKRIGDQEWLHLGNAGSLLLMPEPAQVPTPVEIGFSPIFWNTAWTINQPPHTLGLLIDEAHPALAGFPTAFHSDWQWQPILRHAAALVIDELPRELPVIVRPIDDWHQCRRLGLIFEARCNGGRVLVCAADLRPELDQRPGARCLWDALLRYMDTPGFDPQVEVTPQALKRICGRSR